MDTANGFHIRCMNAMASSAVKFFTAPSDLADSSLMAPPRSVRTRETGTRPALR
jgi:hypothetical protein